MCTASRGVLIALDDMGAGNSNLDRILEVRPDILKLDRSLVASIDKEYRKQESFACCMRIAHKLGIVVIAEGVETESEARAIESQGTECQYPKLVRHINSKEKHG